MQGQRPAWFPGGETLPARPTRLETLLAARYNLVKAHAQTLADAARAQTLLDEARAALVEAKANVAKKQLVYDQAELSLEQAEGRRRRVAKLLSQAEHSHETEDRVIAMLQLGDTVLGAPLVQPARANGLLRAKEPEGAEESVKTVKTVKTIAELCDDGDEEAALP